MEFVSVGTSTWYGGALLFLQSSEETNLNHIPGILIFRQIECFYMRDFFSTIGRNINDLSTDNNFSIYRVVRMK